MKKIIYKILIIISLVIIYALVGDFLSCPFYNPCKDYVARHILFGFLGGGLVFYYIGYSIGRTTK
jgi:hypothetical protein